MTTTTELQQKIAEAQRLKQQATDREAARLAAEQAHRDEIAARDAEIAQLAEQLRESAYADAQAYNTRLVNDNHNQAKTFISALDSAAQQLFQAARNELQAVQRTYAEQSAYASQAVGAALHNRDFRSPDDRTDRESGVRFRGELARLENGLEMALPPWAVVARWIAESPDEQTRRVRIGIGYTMTGELLNPDAGYDPVNELRQRQQAQRNPMF